MPEPGTSEARSPGRTHPAPGPDQPGGDRRVQGADASASSTWTRQHADLTEALDTLENAIRKIDRETRTRFQETFDKVNGGLQAMFPRLFGGGHAYLELTGEDLLDTGVAVMARPPGKRNSTIHLLSGGEKALTAVALVFSIFELNPVAVLHAGRGRRAAG